MHVGENIKKIRKTMGLSQKELAEKLRTSPQNLAQYESGKRNPKHETLKKIADALGVSLYDLLISGNMTPREVIQIIYTSDIEEMLQNLEHKTDDENKILNKIEDIKKMSKDRAKFSEIMEEMKRKELVGKNMEILNADGQNRVIEYSVLLSKDTRYRKDTEESESQP